MQLITGQGNHSVGRRAVLREAVFGVLWDSGLNFDHERVRNDY